MSPFWPSTLFCTPSRPEITCCRALESRSCHNLSWGGASPGCNWPNWLLVASDVWVEVFCDSEIFHFRFNWDRSIELPASSLNLKVLTAVQPFRLLSALFLEHMQPSSGSCQIGEAIQFSQNTCTVLSKTFQGSGGIHHDSHYVWTSCIGTQLLLSTTRAASDDIQGRRGHWGLDGQGSASDEPHGRHGEQPVVGYDFALTSVIHEFMAPGKQRSDLWWCGRAVNRRFFDANPIGTHGFGAEFSMNVSVCCGVGWRGGGTITPLGTCTLTWC